MRVCKQTNWVSLAANPVRLFALIVSLILSQALGFVHGIAHEPHSNHRNHQIDTQLAATTPAAHASWIADLFAGHSEESTCQVFDQLSHGSALLGHAVEIAQLTVASFFQDTYRSATPAYRRSLIQARAPPAVSTSI